MRILVTNDDGITAKGLWALAKELQGAGTVTVVAPDREQSGVGTSVTLHHPLRLREIKSLVKGVNAFSVEGTPADSVILALNRVMSEGVDLVVSGINEGPNLSNDVFISGTVAAALQGYFYGIPAIAISLNAFGDLHFDVAARLARLLANGINDKALPQKLLLNVNLPNVPPEEIEGIEITKLGERRYADNIEPGHDGKRQYYWIVRGKPVWNVSPKSDIGALKQKRISITPLLNNSANPIRSSLKNLIPGLFQELSKDSITQ